MNSSFISPPSFSQPSRVTWLRRLFALTVTVSLVVSLFASAGIKSVKANVLGQTSLPMTVIINEIAWMGTTADPNDEWIELYNPGTSDITFTSNGWVLAAQDGTPSITLTGVIPAGGFFLLERTDDSSVPGITANQIYSGALGNSPGEHLQLYQGAVLIDSANSDGSNVPTANEWPAGDNATKCTLERKTGDQDADVSWVTSNLISGTVCGTPKGINSFFVTPTPTITPSSTPEWERRILINEVAWGGTQADDTLAQWIELYNPSLIDPVNLSGWYLQIPGKGNVPLSGTIAPNGYYLIERNQTDTNVTGSLVYAFPFLDVTGDSLYLYSNTNNLVDSANSSGGPWPAGNRFVNYQSMERRSNELDTDAAWLTFAGIAVASDRLGNLINGSPGGINSLGSTSTPTFTPTATFTPTLTPTFSPTLTPSMTFTPSTAKSVIINEVAWAGTIASDTDEWIELYNPGTASINITGWTLSSGSSFSITLAGAIPAGGYFLLERTDNDTVKDIAADQIFSGSLTNTGMALQLKATSGSVIDTANNSGGAWPAGNATTRCSMERRPGTNYPDTSIYWITNSGVLKNGKDASDNDICGTPRNINWANYVTPTPTSVGPTRTPTKTRTPTPIPAAKISQVIINEFMPHPRSDWNNDGRVDSGDEFIELMNVGNASINLQGWRLDDQNGDSSPYTLGSVDLAPGARLVFFASQTGLLLSNRSDSVRVFKANGSISDAYTYTTVPVPDQSWCRLPDGKPTWVFGCQPTLAQTNQLAETVYRAEVDLPAVCESPNLPTSIYLAECLPSGLDAWSRRLWDGFLPVFQVLYERHGQQYWIE